jgi:hypothetical protein
VVTNDPILAANVPEWLAKSKQVATGNRRRVLEDGDDVMSSSDEDGPKMEPDEEARMYTKEMNPEDGPRKLSQAEANRQRLMAKASRAAGKTIAAKYKVDQEPARPVSPTGEDWSWMSEKEQRLSSSPAPAPPKAATRIEDPEIQVLAKAAPLEIVKTTSVRASDLPEGLKKAAASPRAPANQLKGAKAPTPTKGQQVPKPDGRHPMATRSSDGSGAGGFRPGVGGSGQKDTRVASSHPSKT